MYNEKKSEHRRIRPRSHQGRDLSFFSFNFCRRFNNVYNEKKSELTNRLSPIRLVCELAVQTEYGLIDCPRPV